MRTSPIVFSVISKADIGLDSYYLDGAGYNHILLGHPDLKSFFLGIEDTVKNPTHIFKSNYDHRRLQFVSQNVLSSGGRPMNVIIEIEAPLGRVITASPRPKTNGKMLWDADTGIQASYDDISDILYISHGDSRPSYSVDDETDERIWLRFHEEDDTPAGMTIFQAAKLGDDQRLRLAEQIAEFLNLSTSEINSRIGSLLP